MSSTNHWHTLDHWLHHLATTGPLKPKNIHYGCALCGLISGGLVFAGLISSGFLPPIRPWWPAEQVSEHYETHLVGMHVGSALLMFSGAFFIPFYCAIADQMQRIPDIPWILPQIQLASGTASVIGFLLPGMQLAVASFRKDRDPTVLQLANDSFWIFVLMPFSTFFPLCWSWAYAILLDSRKEPPYPKGMAIANFIVPCMFLWAAAIHTTQSGPFAWNGTLGFWVPLVFFGFQLIGDTYYLLRAIRVDYSEEGNSQSSRALAVSIASDGSKIEV